MAPASAPRVGCIEQAVAVAVLGPDNVVSGINPQPGRIGDDGHAGEGVGNDLLVLRFKGEHVVVARHIGDGYVRIMTDRLQGGHHSIIVVSCKDVGKGLGSVFHRRNPIVQQVPQNDQLGHVIPGVDVVEEPGQIEGMLDQPGVGSVYVHVEVTDEYQLVSSSGVGSSGGE